MGIELLREKKTKSAILMVKSRLKVERKSASPMSHGREGEVCICAAERVGEMTSAWRNEQGPRVPHWSMWKQKSEGQNEGQQPGRPPAETLKSSSPWKLGLFWSRLRRGFM